MNYTTFKVQEISHGLTLTLHRHQEKNSINFQLLSELHHLLDLVERDTFYRFIVLQGENGVFCTGLDFHELMSTHSNTFSAKEFAHSYITLLKRFTSIPKVIVSLLDGQVLAGGVGLVAASDLVLSTARSQMGLTEALWGLLPACVMPYLIRRVGFQKAYFMTLTMEMLTAENGQQIGLIDEISADLNESLRRHLLRLNRVSHSTIFDLKSYFKKMWIITEEMELFAANELTRLLENPTVQSNIKNFVEHQKFPWETYG